MERGGEGAEGAGRAGGGGMSSTRWAGSSGPAMGGWATGSAVVAAWLAPPATPAGPTGGRRALGGLIGGRRGRRTPVSRLGRNRFGPVEGTLAAAGGILFGRLGELHPPRPLLAPGGLDIGEVAGIGMLDLPVVLPEQGEPAPGVHRTEHGLDQERIEGVHHDLRYRVGQAPGSEARSERIAGRLAVGDRRHQVVAARYRKTAQERRSRG